LNSPSSTLPQAALDSFHNLFLIKNNCGVILSCNQAFKDINNLGHFIVIGSTVYDFLPQKEADSHTQADISLIASASTRLDYVVTRETQEGAKSILSVHKSMPLTENGSAEILVVINKLASSNAPLKIHPLSPREFSVLRLLVRGYSQKQIAIMLGISHHTVADYLKAIYIKLGVNTRTQAQLKGILDFGMT
jgi:DNA-binding CsgD family transcriptional regulator